ncbi:MAG: hypothetical protein M0Z68_01425 [Gammaproteobacteria bacterium]|jgi:hypothetical protein|nr:hypothetical protein [Gammaproteobacteria bacterium]
MNPEPGDIVYCRFPCDEGHRIPHYGLVVSVENSATRTTIIRVAYGTSQKVSPSGHLPSEFVVADSSEMRRAGLLKPTRFDMHRVVKLGMADIVEIRGSLDLTDGRILSRLRRACKL